MKNLKLAMTVMVYGLFLLTALYGCGDSGGNNSSNNSENGQSQAIKKSGDVMRKTLSALLGDTSKEKPGQSHIFEQFKGESLTRQKESVSVTVQCGTGQASFTGVADSTGSQQGFTLSGIVTFSNCDGINGPVTINASGNVSDNQITMTVTINGSVTADGCTITFDNVSINVTANSSGIITSPMVVNGAISIKCNDENIVCTLKNLDVNNQEAFNNSCQNVGSGSNTLDPFLSAVSTIGDLPKGLTFDSQNNLYISTVGGKVMKLNGINISTFIPEGNAGLDFNRHIRFSQGNFYVQNVLNVGHATLPHIDEVLLFNSTGAFVRKLLDENAISVPFFEVIAVNAQGQLYVEAWNSSTFVVVRVDSDGKNLTNIVQNSAGGVLLPTSMAIDSNGNLYVGTPSVVSKFSADGTFIAKIAQDGLNGFGFASNLSVDRNNNLYIGNLILGAEATTPSAWNVLRFNSQGAFLGEFIPAGAAGLSAFPDDMAFDSQGRLYIADFIGVDGVARFTQSGAFDRTGVKDFGLSKPLEKSQKQEEKERHYKELELKDKILAGEVSQ